MMLSVALMWVVSASGYVGPQKCALCHKDIAMKQQQTAMANTWQQPSTSWLPQNFKTEVSDDLAYSLERSGQSFTYSVNFPAAGKVTLPAEILMGGRRHGLGFLLPIKQLDGIPLARPALIQARHAWSTDQKKLLIAPGCTRAKPTSLEAALGLTLSPTFQSRCLECHGQPNVAGTGLAGGVHCESCHGPGSKHPSAMSGIINPKKLSNEESIEICARCHVGLTRFSDPSAEDLLVANQVRAIKTSECYLQSRKAFSCTACHDPHSDSTDDKHAEKVCLGCHSVQAAPHSALCPVSASAGCVGCHMPSVQMGALHLVDHLIRVHPNGNAPAHSAASQIEPVSEYLRLISTDALSKATAASARIIQGESFYSVARDVSLDPSAAIGGYLGRKNLSELGAVLSNSAGRLKYGETSPVLERAGRWFILQRMPRDFRWQAEQSQQQAENFAAGGDARGAIETAQQALMIYPHFLRALNFIGVTFAQSGNPQRGAAVLATAARLYPEDATVQFELASVRNSMDDKVGAAAAFRRSIELDQDLTAAYSGLGMISYSSGDWQSAIKTFRAGLQINPMSAELYHGLGLALARSGDVSGAAQANALANKLNGN